MKCVLVIRNPSMPDIVFMWTDPEFKAHIAKSALDRGLLDPDEVSGDLDLSILTQYFSPIIASHGLLSSEMNCPYSSITCDNNFIFVMKQFGQHLYITVNGDGQETEWFLHKKLLVLHRNVQFFFGAATEQFRRDSPRERLAMWETLGSVLDSWCELYHKEQSFLLEAVESLEVNQTLNELCIGLLESVLLKFRSAGDKNAVHAMLVTGAKQLTLYSSRNAAELHPSDVLLLINLAWSLYPAPKDPLQDPAGDGAQQQQARAAERDNRQSAILSDGEFLSAGEGNGSDGTQYYSPANSHGDCSSEDPDEEGQQPHTTLQGQRSPDLADQPSNHPTKPESDGGPAESLPSAVAEQVSAPPVGRGQRSGEKSTSEDSHTDSWCDLAGGAGADTSKIPSIDCTPDRRVPQPPNSQTIWYTPIQDSRPEDLDSNRVSGMDYDHQPASTPTKHHEAAFIPMATSLPTHTHPRAPPPSATPHPASLPSSSSPTTPPAMTTPPTLAPELNPSSSTRRSKRGKKGLVEDTAQVTAFLQQPACPYCPHVLHIVRILPSIVLVVVTEVNSQVAVCVSNCLRRLKDLSNAIFKTDMNEALHKQSSVGKLDADLKQLGNAVKKSRVQGLQQVHTELIKQWMIAKGCGLTTNQASPATMTPRLESILTEMNRILRAIFQRCYVYHNAPLIRPPSRYLPVVADVRASLVESLSLYHEFLAVRAERNLTITNYLEDFPGLVHFVHVNRASHRLLAPSINTTNVETEQGGVLKNLLRDKVWTMVERCYEQMTQGYMLETVRQGDFTFSYFLSFENQNGLPVQNQGLPKYTKSAMPGILAGQYFREVLEHAFRGVSHSGVSCIELFCVHLSVVPTPMITRHARRLRNLLRTGDSITPGNLLQAMI